jgi:hypothetical protein
MALAMSVTSARLGHGFEHLSHLDHGSRSTDTLEHDEFLQVQHLVDGQHR